MGGFWDGVRKSAATGAARVSIAAENVAKRVELQHRISQLESEQLLRQAAIGRSLVTALRAGAAAPAGVAVDLAAIDAADAELERVRAEMASLGVAGKP